MSNTPHEDKFIPSKQPNLFKRVLNSRVLPWFLVTIFTTAITFTIFGWFLHIESVSQAHAAVASLGQAQ